MNASYQPTRLTAYAVISSIEEDIREFLVENLPISTPDKLLPSDAYRAALHRRGKDQTVESERIESIADILTYCDFGDLAKTLHIHNEYIGQSLQVRVKDIADVLEGLVKTRNRVAHSRPMEPEDFPALVDGSRWMVSQRDLSTTHIERTLHLLDESPGKLLYTEIPSYWQTGAKPVEHNLPTPEFYETGFVGRKNDRERIGRFLRGAHPVVSIIGNGGVGKTALAQICLYDFMDPAVDCPYQAIVWVSLKTERLTRQGVEHVRDQVEGSLPILREALEALAGEDVGRSADTESMLRELRTYMDEFNVLLALDNCEATSHDVLRPLLEDIPEGSKLLMTSRTGFGAYEIPYTLGGLEDGPAQNLFRSFARSMNVTSLAEAKTEKISEYCKKLFHNPLAIKWFVASVAGGAEPKNLISAGGEKYENLIEFCFSNVFETFDNNHTAVVDTIMAAGRPLSRTELCLVIDPDDFVEVDAALNYLRYCSIIESQQRSRATGDMGDVAFYGLSEFARQYARSRGSRSGHTVSNVRSRLSDLRVRQETVRSAAGTYKFQWDSVHPRNHDERLVAAELQKALYALKKDDYREAVQISQNALGLKPDFGEPYRILGHIHQKNGELNLADDNFRQAAEVDPDSSVAKYHYGRFLLESLNDYDAALEQLNSVLEVYPNDFAVLSNKAKALMRLGHLEETTEIWESLLSRTDEVEARRARMTVDQAAEAYRRWAELDRKRRDPDACSVHIGRALAILQEGMRDGHIDSVTWKRVEKVVSDACNSLVAFGDKDLADGMVKALKGLRERFHDPIKIHCDSERLVDRLVELGIERETARAMDFVADPGFGRREVTGEDVAQRGGGDERKSAKVSSIPDGKNFAFAVDRDGEDWFFHRNHLANGAEWGSLRVGSEIQFDVGTNEQGACAVDVTVVG